MARISRFNYGMNDGKFSENVSSDEHCFLFLGSLHRRYGIAHSLEHHPGFRHSIDIFEHNTKFAAQSRLLVPPWIIAATNIYHRYT